MGRTERDWQKAPDVVRRRERLREDALTVKEEELVRKRRQVKGRNERMSEG